MTLPSNRSNPDAYEGYKGLPPLVGLLPMTEAISKGLPVEQVTSRLKRIIGRCAKRTRR